MIHYGFEVTEQYGDEAPEIFGTEFFTTVPKVGDVVTLHWLDGRVAYSKTVASVDLEQLKLVVR